MTIQGYFDGTAVHTLEPLDLEPNQTVFINVPSREASTEEKIAALNALCEAGAEYERERIALQKQAVSDLFNLLSDEEVAAFGKAMEEPLIFKTVDIA